MSGLCEYEPGARIPESENSILQVQVDIPDMKVKVEWNPDMKVKVQFQSGYKSAVQSSKLSFVVLF